MRLFFAALLTTLAACQSKPVVTDTHQYYRVERVVDGDTVVIENRGKFRLIGVDTPETKHPKKPVEYFGKEASAFLNRLALNQDVRLEFEGNKTDHYGRGLAYLYLRDGTLINAKIIEEGYGHAYVRYPFSKMEEFRALERQARENRKGLWKDQ